MRRVELPALRSDDTLGFLAGLGLLEILTSVCGIHARLGWEGVGGSASVESEAPGRDALVEALHGVAQEMAADGRVIPVLDRELVPPPRPDAERKALREAGEHIEYDPVRLLPEAAVRRFAATLEREGDGDLRTSRWLVALVNQLASERNGPARALTPLYGPSGRMSLHQMYRDARDAVVGEPQLLREALTAWRRRPGTGANLDARALSDGAVTSTGQADNRAVPGASWLALMALPLFRQVGGSGGRAAAVGWGFGAEGGPRLRWPIWGAALDLAAVETLLSHPAVARAFPAVSPRWERLAAPQRVRAREERHRIRARALVELRAMGVLAVCEARRQPLAKAAGPLLPPSVLPVDAGQGRAVTRWVKAPGTD